MRKPEEAFGELDLKGSAKPKRAPLLGSTRLTLFVIFLLCSCNFILQRFNINFGLVCMHRPHPLILFEDNDPSDFIGNGTTSSILANISKGEVHLESSSLILDDLNNPLPQRANGGESDNGSSSTWITSERIDELERDSPVKCGSGIRKRIKGNDTEYDGEYGTADFAWSKEEQGSIIAAFYYGLTFSQIPCGWIVDRFGAKSSLLLSQFLLSILSLLSPMAAKMGPEYMFAARLMQGIVNGAAMSATYVLATRWCADMERGFLMGIGSAGFGLAAAIVYPITAFFCENMGWEWSFYFYGGTGLLWCVAAFFLIFEWPENHPRIKMAELQFIQKYRAVQYGGAKQQRIKVPWKQMLLSVPVWGYIIQHFCMFWCFLTVSAYLPTFLNEVLNLDISENGLLSALPYVGMMSFHFVFAVLFDKLRERNVCSITVLRKTFNTIGTFASGLSIAALGLIACDNVAGAVFLLTMCQLFLELPLNGGYLFSLFEMAPKYASSLTALSNTFGLLAGFISPAVVSYVTTDGTRDQWLLVFYLSAGIMIFGGLVYLFFGKCTLLHWADEGGTGNTVVDGSALSRSNSKKVEQELKQLKIRLINGESDLKGQRVKSQSDL